MLRPLYRVTTLEEDLTALSRSTGKSVAEVVQSIVSEMLGGGESVTESAESEGDREELAEDTDSEDNAASDEVEEEATEESEDVDADDSEDLSEVARKRVRILRGAEKVKARKYRRKNRAKIKRYARRYRKSAKGKRAIRRRQRMIKRLGLAKKKHPRRVRYQFNDAGSISNVVEEVQALLRPLQGLAPDVSEELVAFAKLAKATDLLADRMAEREWEIGEWNEESLRELAALMAEVADAVVSGKILDKEAIGEAFEEGLNAFTEAFDLYSKAVKMVSEMETPMGDMGMMPDDDEEEPEGDEPEEPGEEEPEQGESSEEPEDPKEGEEGNS